MFYEVFKLIIIYNSNHFEATAIHEHFLNLIPALRFYLYPLHRNKSAKKRKLLKYELPYY